MIATNSSMNWRNDIRVSKYKVFTLPLAERDIAEETDYFAYELESPETAIKMINGFRKTINDLCIFPQRHELDEDEELARYKIRRTYYKSYKIYYLVDEDEHVVYVLRVLHMLVDSEKKVLRGYYEPNIIDNFRRK